MAGKLQVKEGAAGKIHGDSRQAERGRSPCCRMQWISSCSSSGRDRVTRAVLELFHLFLATCNVSKWLSHGSTRTGRCIGGGGSISSSEVAAWRSMSSVDTPVAQPHHWDRTIDWTAQTRLLR
eukprot:TRINITY_DN1189_c0_g1_i3.p2 TRINITY_DN1189_c0_g1~~TRINITY_DN1189_c0_g1_i3.p2  ORF type:complete len:123 (+),score=7.40 TRINITY_DN1189_c0_g1_i3:220-588(+)